MITLEEQKEVLTALKGTYVPIIDASRILGISPNRFYSAKWKESFVYRKQNASSKRYKKRQMVHILFNATFCKAVLALNGRVKKKKKQTIVPLPTPTVSYGILPVEEKEKGNKVSIHLTRLPLSTVVDILCHYTTSAGMFQKDLGQNDADVIQVFWHYLVKEVGLQEALIKYHIARIKYLQD